MRYSELMEGANVLAPNDKVKVNTTLHTYHHKENDLFTVKQVDGSRVLVSDDKFKNGGGDFWVEATWCRKVG